MRLQAEIERDLQRFRLDVRLSAGGKTLGILGPSGSGKSMTLRCIAGLESPSRGQIVLNGRMLFDSNRGINAPSRERRVGFLPQDYSLFPHLTVLENIAFGLRSAVRGEARSRVAELIRQFQLEGLENRMPRELSGGQQQRAALARALAAEPEVLLLDEPLSALDVHLRSQMEMLLIETLSSFRGVSLYVTHNLEEAYRLSEEILVIVNGQVAAYGPREEIFRHPPTLMVAQATGCKNFSRARAINSESIAAIDWGCELQSALPASDRLTFIGIRAHHLEFPTSPGTNTLPCALARAIDGPFRTTLFLRLAGPGAPAVHHHLQAEITRENWLELRRRQSPWLVRLDPDRLILLNGESTGPLPQTWPEQVGVV